MSLKPKSRLASSWPRSRARGRSPFSAQPLASWKSSSFLPRLLGRRQCGQRLLEVPLRQPPVVPLLEAHAQTSRPSTSAARRARACWSSAMASSIRSAFSSRVPSSMPVLQLVREAVGLHAEDVDLAGVDLLEQLRPQLQQFLLGQLLGVVLVRRRRRPSAFAFSLSLRSRASASSRFLRTGARSRSISSSCIWKALPVGPSPCWSTARARSCWPCLR